jgi:hypothetical protein
MMDIMTMMEMWFALVARAPAQVDRINLERPGTVWPAPDLLGQLFIALGSRSVHDFDATFIYKGRSAYIWADISLLLAVVGTGTAGSSPTTGNFQHVNEHLVSSPTLGPGCRAP